MELLQAQRTAHAYSKRYWSYAWGSQVVGFAAVVLSLWATKESWVVSYAAAGLVFSAVAFISKQLASGCDTAANCATGFGLLEDGLGYAGGRVQKAMVTAMRPHPTADKDSASDAYFTSELPQGWARLADSVAESAFFTAYQSRLMVHIYAGLALLGTICTVTGFVVFSQFTPSAPQLSTCARLALALLSLFGTGDLVALAIGYHRQAGSCNQVARGADVLSRETAPDPAAVVFEFNNYTAGLGRVPPFPAFLWRRYRDMLNRTWASSHARTET